MAGESPPADPRGGPAARAERAGLARVAIWPWRPRLRPECAARDEPDGPRTRLPIVDTDACTGCGRCVRICEEGCLEMIWSFATLTRPEACVGEGACAEVCESGVIRMGWVAGGSGGCVDR